MKRFAERNLLAVAAVGTAILMLVVVVAINFSKLPFVSDQATYHAEFTDAAGLVQGDPVSVAGVDVGTVTGLSLFHARVLVSFTVQGAVRLGDDTSVAAKVLTPLGQEFLAVEPRGGGRLASGAVIAHDRTSETATLVSTADELGHQTAKIDIAQLERALNVTSQDLEAIPPGSTASILTGLAQLSGVISSRSNELSQLVTDVKQLSGTLAGHSAQLVTLLGQGDLVLQVLNQRHQAIEGLLTSTASLTQQLDALLTDHRAQLSPLVTDLQTISGVLAKDGGDLATAIPLLTSANKYLANVTGSGDFGDFVLPTGLIPDNVIAQCTKPGATKALTGCNP
jgi:phospholipid/cholesterol/gamma-HCH transport system substrate-binding protein